MGVLLSTSIRSVAAVAAVAVILSSDTPNAHAQDFFPFFDNLSGRPEPPSRPAPGYSGSGHVQPAPRRIRKAARPRGPSRPAPEYGESDHIQFPPKTVRRTLRKTVERTVPQDLPSWDGGDAAYCVRTCDGRYFPVSGNNDQSRAATCSSLCPSSDTKVFTGTSIDSATNNDGKSYTSLPNAFKYREQFVSGCTCNGKDPIGLASMRIEDDRTIQKGDIVAGDNGLIVATRAPNKKRGKLASFSPAPKSIRAKFERAHAMARDEPALKRKRSTRRSR